MEVRCEKCQARYRVDDARIGPQGLTMRCGKCQNTFKVMRPGAPAALAPGTPAAAQPPPAAPQGAAEAERTMIFVAPKPGAPAPAPTRPAPPPADEAAGRTMMFQTGSARPPASRPESAPQPAASPRPATDASPSTMVFGKAPAIPPAGGGSTMIFAEAPAPARPPDTAPSATGPDAHMTTQPDLQAAGAPPAPAVAAGPPVLAAAAPVAEPAAVAPPASPGDAPSAREQTMPAEVASGEPQGRFDRAPPRALLLGVAAALGLVLLGVLAFVAIRKLGSRPPPAAAVEALTAAATIAEQDSLTAIADAEGRMREALDAAGSRARWPQGRAALASVEVQWADALSDEAAFWSDRANRAAQTGDEARRADADAKAQKAQDGAKERLHSAFEIAAPAAKADPKSAELSLAMADYYRAQRSASNMNRELRRAQALKADDARVQLVQGFALSQDEDSADRSIPKLKAGLAANPSSARIHFRLAMAYLAVKDVASARSELQETLRLSPGHERAKMAMEQIARTAQK